MTSPLKHARQVLSCAREDADPFGAAVSIGYGHGGHPHLVITRGDVERRLTFANTPRASESSLKRTRSNVRRLLRAMEGR